MGTGEDGSTARVVVEANGSTPKRIIIFTRESGMRDRSLCDCFKPRLIPTGPFKAVLGPERYYNLDGGSLTQFYEFNNKCSPLSLRYMHSKNRVTTSN